MGASSDGKSCRKHCHIGHAGQNNLFTPRRIGNERNVPSCHSHGGDKDIHYQKQLAKEQYNPVCHIICRPDFINLLKYCRHIDSPFKNYRHRVYSFALCLSDCRLLFVHVKNLLIQFSLVLCRRLDDAFTSILPWLDIRNLNHVDAIGL